MVQQHFPIEIAINWTKNHQDPGLPKGAPIWAPQLFRPSAGVALSEVHREVGHGEGLSQMKMARFVVDPPDQMGRS